MMVSMIDQIQLVFYLICLFNDGSEALVKVLMVLESVDPSVFGPDVHL